MPWLALPRRGFPAVRERVDGRSSGAGPVPGVFSFNSIVPSVNPGSVGCFLVSSPGGRRVSDESPVERSFAVGTFDSGGTGPSGRDWECRGGGPRND